MVDGMPNALLLREKLAANKRCVQRREMAADLSAIGGAAALVCDRFSIECRSPAYDETWQWIGDRHATPPDLRLAWLTWPTETELRDFFERHALDGPCFIIGGKDVAVGADAADAPALIHALETPLHISIDGAWVACAGRRWLLQVHHASDYLLWRSSVSQQQERVREGNEVREGHGLPRGHPAEPLRAENGPSWRRSEKARRSARGGRA